MYSKLATISTAGKVANSATTATSADTANAIVARDASGDFTTNMITIDGTTTNPTDVATKAYVDAQGGGGTSLNTPNTTVKRDNTGSFAAQEVSVNDVIASGNLVLSTDPSTATMGNIMKGSTSFIHNAGGDDCTFVGENAGNFTMSGASNSGFGVGSLQSNTQGYNNLAIGSYAMQSNTTGSSNVAVGLASLQSNTAGNSNTGCGISSLQTNISGSQNTAVGAGALFSNTTDNNTSCGYNALYANTTGTSNTAMGAYALVANTTGSRNIAFGLLAGSALAGGNDNIYIANTGATESGTIRIGTSGTQTTCFVSGIRGVTTGAADALAVLIDSNGQLGTISSSQAVKHDIKNMGDLSDTIFNLRPVTFVYNGDESNKTQYGLIAEEVAEILNEIVVYDEKGQPFSVQYHMLPILLLNEIQKQRITIEELKKNNTQRDAIIQDLMARIAALEARA